MILDHLNNISIYFSLSDDIRIGLEYLAKLSKDIELGEYKINDNVFAIVSEYFTKEKFENGFEAHKNVIDIQYPIVGRERIKWTCVDRLTPSSEYDPLKDVTFYNDYDKYSLIDIGENIFAIFFPADAHAPQHYVDQPEFIKKVTLKIKF